MTRAEIKANKLGDIKLNLDDFNPSFISKHISGNFKKRRLELNLTQVALSGKSGVSLGSIKRFENCNEISLKHLLMVAVVLQSTEEFYSLFSRRQYNSISEVLQANKVKTRKRARGNA